MGHPYSRVRSQKTLYLWRRIGLTQDVIMKEYAKILYSAKCQWKTRPSERLSDNKSW
jgi:hypothetical protein